VVIEFEEIELSNLGIWVLNRKKKKSRILMRDIAPLFPLLRQGIYHRTSIENYQLICKGGYILPNDGNFRFTCSQSQHSYAFAKRYISLFDFETVPVDHCIMTRHIWSSFFVDQEPATVILKLDRTQIEDKLIPNHVRPKPGSPDYKIAIPFVEVWYPRPIPVSAIQSRIIASCPSIFEKISFEEYDNSRVAEFENVVNTLKEQELESANALDEDTSEDD